MKPEQSIILAGDGLSPLKHYPGGLEGLPTFEEIPTDEVIGKDDKGAPIFKKKVLPVEYFMKEVAQAKQYCHRGEVSADGNPRAFGFTTADFDETIQNFQERRKAGITPWIPDYHEESYRADINNGQIIDLKREGNSLLAKMKLVGSAAIEKTKKNDVSVWLDNADTKPIFDATGKRYKGWVLQHVALTPNPALNNLKPFTRIAASADQPSRDVPIFVLSATSMQRSPEMDPKVIANLRKQFGWGNDIPDDQVPVKAAEQALALSCESGTLKQQVTDLTKERDTLKADVTAKEQQVLALSADAPKKPDALVLSMYAENVAAKREAAIKNGLTEPQAKLFDEIIIDNQGMPTALALSVCGKDRKPLAFKLWDALTQLTCDGVRIGNSIRRGVDPARPLLLSGEGDQEQKKMMDDASKQAEDWKNQQLAARGLT
jgi:hypothetical protein